MSGFWQVTIGMALVAGGWLAPRWVAGSRGLGWAAIIDAAPTALIVLLLFAASGRPIFAGTAAFALGAGYAFADRTVRATLREPVVFTALSELPQVFTHPHLYLPFAGTGTVIAAVAAAVTAGVALLLAEPPLATPQPLCALIAAAAVAGLLWRLGREPWLGQAAGTLARLRPSGKPFVDAAQLGPVAMPIVHGIIARSERPALQRRLSPPPCRQSAEENAAGPIVLVQCESFFDARRALPLLPKDFLAGFDTARAAGLSGRLAVPAWGANTMRAEFQVLTGTDDAALGYDRFNPYHALARTPIRSQVWRLRAAGYRTLCLHPFDRRFFRRDLAMPALGFEQFRGRESLGGSRTPPYMSDPDLARHILRAVDELGPRVFVFAITMGNHGPWFGKALADDLPEADLPADLPERDPLSRYLGKLHRSDEMLRVLIEGLRRRHPRSLLGFYGDHLPSLPRAFAALDFDDWRSDYAIWSAGGLPARRRDLSAHELGHSLVDLALAPSTVTPRTAVVAEPHPA